MSPRIKTFIFVAILIYIALSLYHWQKVKNLPGIDQRNGVSGVLKGNDHEKNWVQVTTVPAQPAKKEVVDTLADTNQSREQNTDQKLHEKKKPSAETPSPIKSKTTGPAYQELETELQKQKEINLQQSVKIKEQFVQILSLQASLDAANEKIELGQKTKDSVDPTPTHEKISSLTQLLQTKIKSLNEANRRIYELADRLDQARLTLTESENSIAHLQDALANTETKKIEAEKKSETYLAELLRTRDEKEKYLAETGRLYTQLQQTRTRLSHIEDELTKVKLQAEAMYRFGYEQDELVTPFRQQIEILNARVADKNSELIAAEDATNILMQQITNKESKIATLHKDLQVREDRIAELEHVEQVLAQEKKKNSELSLQVNGLVTQLNERDHKVASLRNELNESRSSTGKLQNQAEVLQKKNEELNSEITQIQQHLSAAKEQLSATKNSQQLLQDKLKKIATEKQELIRQSTALELQLEKIKAAAIYNQQQNKEQAGKKEKDSALQATKNLQLLGAEKKIKELQLALHEAKQNETKAAQEIQQLKEAITASNRKAIEGERSEVYQKEVEQLRTSLAEKENLYNSLQQNVSELTTENKSLQEQIRAIEENSGRLADLEQTVAELNLELKEKQDTLSASEQKAVELYTELDRREKEFFTLQEQHTKLQNSFDTLQEERDRLFLYTLDSDSDSITDALDICPDTVTGAIVGPDGCELDSDGDTVVDRLDLCPNTEDPGVVNSFGCSPDLPIVLSGLYFSGGNAELSPASQEFLDSIIPALLTSGTTRFEVGGHTDSIGDDERNRKVSELRAEAVRTYLINNGMSEERLETMGYGSTQPVADNSTAEGRAANRRVELTILPRDEDQAKNTGEQQPIATEEEADLPTQSENPVKPQTD